LKGRKKKIFQVSPCIGGSFFAVVSGKIPLLPDGRRNIFGTDDILRDLFSLCILIRQQLNRLTTWQLVWMSELSTIEKNGCLFGNRYETHCKT